MEIEGLKDIDEKWQRMLRGERPIFYVVSNKDLCEVKSELRQRGLVRWIPIGSPERADVHCDFIWVGRLFCCWCWWWPWHHCQGKARMGPTT